MSHHTAAYRPDIDGLRAVAVGSVLLFHAFPDSLPGGFAGVDIFFVISGYLISGILLGQLERGQFSLADFYYRRIRRIFPALLLVLGATLAFGWITLLADEYARLGKHVGGGAAFIANLLLWHEAGYFDPSADTKPLLHLWSLAVEEQFYLVWPILLWAAWRWRLSITGLIIIIVAASFALSLWQTSQDPTAAFYSPLTRFWELLAGAALAWWQHGGRRAPAPVAWLLSLGGAVLLAAGFAWVRETHFPGAWALLPVLGAAFLIAAGANAPVNRLLLAARPMVWVGLISYPLYLWHWPLLSYARILQAEPSATVRWMLLGLSVVLAWATWRFAETPIRRARRRLAVAAPLLTLMAALGLGGLAVYLSNGMPDRTVVQQNIDPIQAGFVGGWPSLATDCAFVSPEQQRLFTCATDARQPPRFALVGDSKAGALFPGLFRAAHRGGTWLLLSSGDAGPLLPVLTDSPVYAYYDSHAIRIALTLVAEQPEIDTVVLAMAMRALFQLPDNSSIETLPDSPYGDAALDGVDRAVSLLVSHGKQVVLLVDNPTLPDMKDCMGRQTASPLLNLWALRGTHPNCQMPLARYLSDAKPYYELLARVAERHPGKVHLFNATEILCDTSAGICPPWRAGQLMYGVTDHLSDHAATEVGRALNDWLNPPRAARDDVPPVHVEDWGAREAVAGQGMNLQPDGSSALWVRATNFDTFSLPIYVQFGDHKAPPAHLNDVGLTTAVPAAVIRRAGDYEVTVVEASGRRIPLGTLRIIAP